MKCELSNEKMLELNRDKTKAYNELYIVTVTRKMLHRAAGLRHDRRPDREKPIYIVMYRDGMTVSLCRLR